MRLTRYLMLLLAVVVLLTGCFDQAGRNDGPASEPVLKVDENSEENSQESYSNENANNKQGEYTVLAEHLRIPWAISFFGDDVYISERGGTIVQVDSEGNLIRKQVQVEKYVFSTGEAGLLGFVLTPDFETSREAYAYHTYRESGRVLNRIIRLKEQDEAWVETEVLLDAVPGGNVHDGGRLAIGPDGHLYATTGDAWDRSLSQDLNSLAGKILRMTLNGKVPEDNPFDNSYVYSYGHRNPQGITWNDDDDLYSSEHGPNAHDEINQIKPGSNYGWPDVFGDNQLEDAVPPLFHTGQSTIAPSGIAFGTEGKLLIAALRGEGLYEYDPQSGTIETVLEGEGRFRDVKIHNGQIYVITNNTDGRGSPSATDDRLLLLKQ
ncbi:sorbosone dehydrogenase family protein [Paenibacillus tarimensis]